MSNQFDYRCPACGSGDDIDISTRVWVRLTADGSDADASLNGGSEWDKDSGAECGACGYTGTVLDFDPQKLAIQVRELIARCDEQGIAIEHLVAQARNKP